MHLTLTKSWSVVHLFLSLEYPFEWTGVYRLKAGNYELFLGRWADPNMSLVAVSNQNEKEEALREGAEWCVRRYAEPPQEVFPGDTIPIDLHVDLQLQSKGYKGFLLKIKETQDIGLFTQHAAEEFNIKLFRGDDEDKVRIPLLLKERGSTNAT